MKKSNVAVLTAVVAVAAFVAGSFHRKTSPQPASPEGRRVLYYVDPMHPAYKSAQPGVAPDCGMQLEPVYAGAASPALAEAAVALPRGAVSIDAGKQQLMGIRIEEAQRSAGPPHMLVVGRVAADERRVYFLNAATDGWIRDAFSNSAGSLVHKDEVLATCYAPEFRGAEQAYFYALSALERFQAAGQPNPDQMEVTRVSVSQAADGLRNLGMGEVQIQALARERQITENIEIRSPASGVILERNVSPGLRFERGKQLYRIADLSRVWVLADLFENESRLIKPGQSATVKYQGRSWQARTSGVLPQFDPATRTLKVRFEVDNAGYVLRPDMFVDVEWPVQLPQAVTVPADAVIDSGLKKTVYVERGGVFEPRRVETGWRFGDRVAISSGLEAGERVVVSGNFLIDSETRMKHAAPAAQKQQPAKARDPVCGMEVDPANALMVQHQGKTYYFCSSECKRLFEKSPDKYAPRKPS